MIETRSEFMKRLIGTDLALTIQACTGGMKTFKHGMIEEVLFRRRQLEEFIISIHQSPSKNHSSVDGHLC